MKPIQAGKMRSWVTIYKPPSAEGTQDAYGEPTDPARKVIACWAKVHPQSGREFQQASSTFADLTHLIEIRWIPGIKASYHLFLDGRRMDLLGPPVNEEERNVKLVFFCREAEERES